MVSGLIYKTGAQAKIGFQVFCFRICWVILILLLPAVYIFIFPISGGRSTSIQLPFKRAPKKFISSVFSTHSRLGNHIFELAALVGIAETVQRHPIFFIENSAYREMLEETNRIIPGLIDQLIIVNETMPKSIKKTVFQTRCCIFEDPRVLESINEKYIFLSGKYYQSFKYFSGMRDKMISYLKKPEHELTNLPKSNKHTFVNCVHVRRGDFARFGFHLSDANFIKNAMKHIESTVTNKKRKMVTVIFGDDIKFMRSLINDTVDGHSEKEPTHFISQNSPSDDLLYAKHHCDTVFISAAHSTFGWWMGYFSKENNVYYTDIRATSDSRYLEGEVNPVDYYPPHWKPLKYASCNNFTIVES